MYYMFKERQRSKRDKKAAAEQPSSSQAALLSLHSSHRVIERESL